jgi:hypothetical protein
VIPHRKPARFEGRRGTRPGSRPFAFVAGVVLLLAGPAAAVIIDSGDGTGNTDAPPIDPGWANVGSLGGLSAVYVGNGWVLTANHVPVGPVELDGLLYDPLPGAGAVVQLGNGDGSMADLKLFAVTPTPDLPMLPLRSTPAPVGSPVLMVGRGRDRGDPFAWDPNGASPPGLIGGYAWGAGARMRWGVNRVEGYPGIEIFDTVCFFTRFDSDDAVHEAQAAVGDSGGAVFVYDGVGWQLAGVMFAIESFDGQPAQTALYGNLTWAADLSFYHDDIVDVVMLPEPPVWSGLLCCAAVLAAGGGRRIRR